MYIIKLSHRLLLRALVWGWRKKLISKNDSKMPHAPLTYSSKIPVQQWILFASTLLYFRIKIILNTIAREPPGRSARWTLDRGGIPHLMLWWTPEAVLCISAACPCFLKVTRAKRDEERSCLKVSASEIRDWVQWLCMNHGGKYFRQP